MLQTYTCTQYTIIHIIHAETNLTTVKWAQWDKTQSRELLGLFIALCTIVAHNIAQNRPDNFLSYPPDNRHCSDDVYLREGEWVSSPVWFVCVWRFHTDLAPLARRAWFAVFFATHQLHNHDGTVYRQVSRQPVSGFDWVGFNASVRKCSTSLADSSGSVYQVPLISLTLLCWTLIRFSRRQFGHLITLVKHIPKWSRATCVLHFTALLHQCWLILGMYPIGPHSLLGCTISHKILMFWP